MAETERLARARQQLTSLADSTHEQYRAGRRVLSFDEFLDLFAAQPVRQGRDASRYLRDMFDHFGRETVARPR